LSFARRCSGAQGVGLPGATVSAKRAPTLAVIATALAAFGCKYPDRGVRGLVFCGAFAFAERSVHRTWGDNSVSSLTVKPKVLALALARAHFLRRVFYLQRIQGVLDGVSRGPVGPPGPRGLS
jgi:hypothetical protein